MQKAFVLDLNKCTGCQACGVACAVENRLVPGTSWRTVSTFNEGRLPGLPVFHLSLACNHCLDPPCMEHCPALAYTKDDATGAVTIDPESCIGCKYCTWACPFDAPRFDPASGVVTKCTFCQHRLSEGEEPACVSQCPTGALQLSDDLETAPGVAEVPGLTRTEVGPAVRFIPLRGERPTVAAPEEPPATRQVASGKITIRSEWPLLIFTLLAAALVGVVAAPGSAGRVHPFVFVVLAGAGMGLSTLHLGRKARAWRAILNWRRSWLSREIILFSLFAAAAAAHLFTGGAHPSLAWFVAAAGFAALFAMDRVYGVTRAAGLRAHSARLVLTGLLVLGIAAGPGPLFPGVAAVKAFLYAHRKLARPVRLSAATARILLGLIVPATIWLGEGNLALVVAGVAVGEIIDRWEFYADLDTPTPRRQLAEDLEAALSS
jgi:Fe-S-cluster-containing dehydrogenase component/DMSO reductase anchor subunit